MTERITWDTCPQCGRYAAVGWLDGIPSDSTARAAAG
jgi:hypothetical protein